MKSIILAAALIGFSTQAAAQPDNRSTREEPPARGNMTYPDKDCTIEGIARAIETGNIPLECWDEDSINRWKRNGTGRSQSEPNR